MTFSPQPASDILDRIRGEFGDSPMQCRELERTFWMFAMTALVERVSFDHVIFPANQVNKEGHGEGFEGTWSEWLNHWKEKFAADREEGYSKAEPVEDYFVANADGSLGLTAKAAAFMRARLKNYPDYRAL